MNPDLLAKAKYVKKLLIFLAAAAAEAVNEGLVPEKWSGYVTIGIGALAALGIYQAKNIPLPNDAAPPDHGDIPRETYEDVNDTPGRHSEEWRDAGPRT